MRRAQPSRRGGVYVLVLVAVLTCSAIVVGGLELVRARHYKADIIGDYWQASANAAAGLEMAVREIETTHDWRWNRGDGEWIASRTMPGGGAVTIEASGLTLDARDTFDLTAIGTHGGARAISSVTVGLQPGGGAAEVAAAVGKYGVLAWWPMRGAASDWADERVSATSATDQKYGAGETYPGAHPGPGLVTAPWFWGDSSVSLGDAGNLDSVRTVSAWIWAEDTTSKQYVIEREDLLTLNGEWGFYVQSGEIHAEYVGLAALRATASSPIAAQRWHHVVLVAEASRIVLYVDGVATDTAGMALSNYWNGTGLPPVRVSGYYGSLGIFSQGFTGSVCEVILMSDAMSAADVATLHAAYPPPGDYRALADGFKRDVR